SEQAALAESATPATEARRVYRQPAATDRREAGVRDHGDELEVEYEHEHELEYEHGHGFGLGAHGSGLSERHAALAVEQRPMG
ncbi:MAG TPA: hypothetical protein VH372_20770, partial [Actinospica sp.]|nr:hypothetical protein [Actinospica sp.]